MSFPRRGGAIGIGGRVLLSGADGGPIHQYTQLHHRTAYTVQFLVFFLENP